MVIDGKKYHHVFTAGSYPQGNIDEAFLKEVAKNYDPKNFHEAPVWIGHPDDQEGSSEPEALGWIDSVIAIGGKLYVSFSAVSDKLKQLIDSQTFKRVSVELVKYKTDDGLDVPYLYAIGLTNRPAVKGLEPITFGTHKFNTDFAVKYFYNDKLNNPNMNMYIQKIAKKLGIDVTKFTTDETLTDEITRVSDEKPETKKAEPESENTETETNSPEVDQLSKEVAMLKEERVAALVDNAINAKKILPKDKASWVSLAKGNYTAAKATLESLSVRPELADKQVAGAGAEGADLEDPKFLNKEGQKMTYREYIKLDPDKQKLSETEVAELKKQNY